MRIYISFIVLCLLGGNVFAQNFQRNYSLSSDESMLNIAGLQLNDGSYVTMDGVMADSATFRNIVMTHYDKKGSIDWSKEVQYLDSDTIKTVLTGGSLFQGDNDSLYFTLTLFRDEDLNKFVGAMDNKGESGWGRIINDNSGDIQTEIGFNAATNYIDSSFLQIANLGEEDNSVLTLNQIGYDGSLRKSVKLTASFGTDLLGAAATDVEMKKDSSIMIVGALNNSGTYFLNVLDKDFNPTIVKTFGDSVNVFSIYGGLDVKETPDTGYIVTGQFLNIDFVNIDSSYIGSFVTKHDSLGDVVWSKRLNIDNMVNTTNGIVVNSDGTIMVAANIVDNTMSNSLISKLSANGDQQWVKLYNMVNVPILPLGSFEATMDGGYAFFTSAAVNDSLFQPNFIKTDAEGGTTCEDTLFKTIFEDIPLVAVDYDLEVTDFEELSLDEYGYNAVDFLLHSTVKISLESKKFCPNEQINFLLDASVEGATSYLWNTGETTDTLRIFDDEQYTVIVTIGERVCFTLCDTVAMERHDLPSVSGSYACDNGEYNLTIQPGASAGIDSIVWSTGAKNVNQIRVTEQGSYSVTITDNCGETASTTINVDPPAPVFLPVYNCTAPGIFLLSQFDPAQTLSIAWSTGAQDDGKHQVAITDKGKYTVTLTDVCNETVVGEVDFNPSSPTVSVNGECLEDGIKITATVMNNTGILSTMWNTGSQDDNKTTITVPAIGTFTVTITDFCRESAAATENFNPPPSNVLPVVGNCASPGQGRTVVLTQLTNGFKSSVWSTGAQDNDKSQVIIAAPGSYSVTITDLCNLTSSAIFTIPEPIDQLTITPNYLTACNGGNITLSAAANGSDQFVTYTWNTGFVGKSIAPSQFGTYTVTATDGCVELVESITITESDLPLEVVALDILLDSSDFCVTKQVVLTAAIIGTFSGIEWSTGETTGEISVPVNGQAITLTAFDECGNEIRTKEINLNSENTLQFAQVFFPEGQELENPENRLFGGYMLQEDTMEYEMVYESIEDFEFHIFNRWGQEMFMSKDVLDRWNGNIDNEQGEDKKALPDVYIWYATYKNPAGCVEELKGDITLFR